jgi:dethiobiotin synthetase
MTSLFITGTDTEVGKTVISVAIMASLQKQGELVVGMKPIASGCEVTEHGLRNEDAIEIQQQCSNPINYQIINPYAFQPAIAPHIAAKQVGVEIDIQHIQKQFCVLQQGADSVIVEGAGGWLVPLNDKLSMEDLAIRLGLPVVVVVSIKLGCINHALLTIQAIEQSGLPIYGWVANRLEANSQADEIINTLKNTITAPCLGDVPHLSSTEQACDYINLEKGQ